MRRFALTLALVLPFLLGSCASSYKTALKNNSGAPLTYCPVEPNPPPPKRVVSNQIVTPPERFAFPADGFNPVFWDPVSGLAAQIQLSLDIDPPEILVRVLDYQVPPGQEGSDPATWPLPIQDYYMELDPSLKIITVRVGLIADQMPVEIVQS